MKMFVLTWIMDQSLYVPILIYLREYISIPTFPPIPPWNKF